MNTRSRLLAALVAASVSSLSFAGITAIDGGVHDWAKAPWTAGAPAAADTAFLNDNADVTVTTPVTLDGVRLGNNTTATSKLELAGGLLGATFLVVGDAPNSNAEFTQTGGTLVIRNTRHLDFEVGNPQNASTEVCSATAVFTGGEANLADVRINIRPFRETRLSVVGSKPRLQAASLSADAGGTTAFTVGVLDFVFDAQGVATINVTGELNLGAGQHLDLQVDGRAYRGSQKSFILVSAALASGRFHNVDLKGFPAGSSVNVADGKVVLTLP